MVRRFTLPAEHSLGGLLEEIGRRLAGTGASAERTLWHGGVHVNGRPLDPDAPPPTLPGGAWVVAYAFAREPEPVVFGASRVLHDADGVVAVDKPAWLPMQRTRASARLSLEVALRELLGDPRLVAVHRLDRQTSGVALFARGRAGAWATRAFAERRVDKRYLAVVAPAPARDDFPVEGWIGRVPDPARFRFELHAEERSGARWSRTAFWVVARGQDRALVEARPETGRTHQIRVHLAASGAPILGDALYGPPDPAERAGRVLLHATAIALERPDGTRFRIEAAPPEDLRAVMPEDLREAPPGDHRAPS